MLCLVAQLCLTLCNPIEQRLCSLPGSSVHGILQARILEWVACPPPGDLPNPGIKPRSPTLWVDSLPSKPPEKPINKFRKRQKSRVRKCHGEKLVGFKVKDWAYCWAARPFCPTPFLPQLRLVNKSEQIQGSRLPGETKQLWDLNALVF